MAIRVLVGGQSIQTRKYADDFVLMAKEEKVLQGMINKLTEVVRCCSMEINVEKNKRYEDFKTNISSNNYDKPNTIGECRMF